MIFDLQGNSKITQKARGKHICAQNSNDAQVIKLEVDGKTEQFTTTGKNILNNNAKSSTVNGIAFTINEDKSITFSGTATANAEKRISDSVPITAGNYIFSIQHYDTAKYIVNIKIVRNGGTPVWVEFGETDRSFTINDGDTIEYTSVVVKSGATVNTTIYPMIRLSSISDATYEPYTNGASPSPEYPQDIKGVGDSGNVEVTVTGKNLLENKAQTTTVNGVIFTVNADKSVTVNGKASGDAYFNIAEKITIPSGRILSGCPNGGSNTTYSLHAWYNSSIVKIDSGAGVVFTEDFTANEIYIAIRSGVTVNNLTFYPMIRKAEITDNTYEPYKKSQTVSIPLKTPLYEGDNVTLKNGKLEVVRNNASVTFDGSNDEGGSYSDSSGIFLIGDFAKGNDVQHTVRTSHFLSCNADYWAGIPDKNCMNFNNAIGFKYSTLTSLSEWKTWLSDNPISVVYKLAKPTTEVIETDIDLSTYCNVTHITNNCDASMEVEYFTNNPNGEAILGLQGNIKRLEENLKGLLVVENVAVSAGQEVKAKSNASNTYDITHSDNSYIPISAYPQMVGGKHTVCRTCLINKGINNTYIATCTLSNPSETDETVMMMLTVIYMKM